MSQKHPFCHRGSGFQMNHRGAKVKSPVNSTGGVVHEFTQVVRAGDGVSPVPSVLSAAMPTSSDHP